MLTAQGRCTAPVRMAALAWHARKILSICVVGSHIDKIVAAFALPLHRAPGRHQPVLVATLFCKTQRRHTLQ